MRVQRQPEMLGHRLSRASSVERAAPPSLQIAIADGSRRQPPGEARWPEASVPSHADTDKQEQPGET